MVSGTRLLAGNPLRGYFKLQGGVSMDQMPNASSRCLICVHFDHKSGIFDPEYSVSTSQFNNLLHL